jgi:hypothetical protein
LQQLHYILFRIRESSKTVVEEQFEVVIRKEKEVKDKLDV